MEVNQFGDVLPIKQKEKRKKIDNSSDISTNNTNNTNNYQKRKKKSKKSTNAKNKRKSQSQQLLPSITSPTSSPTTSLSSSSKNVHKNGNKKHKKNKSSSLSSKDPKSKLKKKKSSKKLKNASKTKPKSKSKSRAKAKSSKAFVSSKSSRSSKSSKSSPSTPTTVTTAVLVDDNYNINDHILLSKDREGVIKFIGNVHFTDGIVYGIELLNGSIGKNDGMIDNERYFKTEEKRGLFVKKSKIRRKIRDKDYKSSSRLKRHHSLQQKGKSFNVIDMDLSDIVPSANTIKANDINTPKTDEGKELIKKKKDKKHKHKHKHKRKHSQRRSSSATRSGDNSNNEKNEKKNKKYKKHKIKKKKSDKSDRNRKLKRVQSQTVTIASMAKIDNKLSKSDNDDNNVNDDDEQSAIIHTDNGLIEEPKPWEIFNNEKRIRLNTVTVTSTGTRDSITHKQQSVDDMMIIDDYFSKNNNNSNNNHKTVQSHNNYMNRRQQQQQIGINRVHSRIPDRRLRKNAVPISSNVPLSFKQFQKTKKSRSPIPHNNNNSYNSNKYNSYKHNNPNLSDRRNRDHIFNNTHHIKNKSVDVKNKNKNKNKIRKVTDYGVYHSSGSDSDDKNKNKGNKIKRRNSISHNQRSSPRHKKTTSLKSIQQLSPKSVPNTSNTKSAPNINKKNDKKDKKEHSRFSSVTSAFSKGWKFAKAKSNDDRKDKKKKNKKFNKKDGNKMNKNCIFGVNPLKLDSTLYSDRDYKSAIPNVLIKLRDNIFMNDGDLTEGIFRKAPNAVKCKHIKSELNNGKLLDINFNDISPILIANLIKIWFRQLPESILQSINSSKIEKCQSASDISHVLDIINDLNEPFKSYYLWLLDLCVDITKNDKINLMTIKNMAVVVSPNLYDPTKIANPMRAMSVSAAIVQFLELSIKYRKQQLIIYNK